MINKLNLIPSMLMIALLSSCVSNQDKKEADLYVKPIAITKNSSNNPNTLYQMGRYYQGRDKFDLAIDAYLKALNIDATFVEASNGLGVIYAQQRQFDKAIETLKSAVAKAPNASHILNNLGYTYYLKGSLSDAIATFTQVLNIDPTNQHAINNLAIANANSEIEVSKLALADNKIAHADRGIHDILFREVPILDKKIAPNSPVLASRMMLVQIEPNVFELSKPSIELKPEIKKIESQSRVLGTSNPKIEVANGNGINGMAGKVGLYLIDKGFKKYRITNQKPFQTTVTQIQYRTGYLEAAQKLTVSLQAPTELIEKNDLRADISLRLLLGKDLSSRIAFFDAFHVSSQLALNIY
ncbi:MAG: tetratricopeptide repeat protein [Methylophilales bacterium]|nr:tetratricopeptide repeat protein [Methylophilales bacterium]